MISTNSSRILCALKTLNSVANKPTIHVLPALLKIAAVNNPGHGVNFCQTQIPQLKQNTSLNQFSQKVEPSKLNSIVKQDINDISLLPKKSNEIWDNITRKASIPVQSSFKLANEISRLYPITTTSKLDGFDRLVVFGDSLSDSKGRMFEKTHHIFPSYNQYYDGRFTNGFVWGEYLSSPAFLNKGLVNFAEGGSTSASYSGFNLFGNFLSNLHTQMKGYKASDRDLTIFFAGANDYITLHKDDVLHVVEKQIDDVTKLLEGKVKHVLVMGMPDISLTPDSQHSEDKRKFKDITIAHNTLLQKNVEELKAKYPDKKIFFFDTNSALKKIINVARDVGYDTRHSYTKHGYIHLPIEHDPELNIAPEYLYNDGVHPTQEVHHAFATLLTHFISENYASTTAAS